MVCDGVLWCAMVCDDNGYADDDNRDNGRGFVCSSPSGSLRLIDGADDYLRDALEAVGDFVSTKVLERLHEHFGYVR
jgi:hypothetical protein